MKKISLVLAFCVCAIGVAQKTEIQKRGLKGRVKAVKEQIFDATERNGILEKTNEQELFSPVTSYFDESGMLIDTDGPVPVVEKPNQGRTISKFDNDGNEIEKVKYDVKGNFIGNEIWHYSPEGKLLEWVAYEPNHEMEWQYIYQRPLPDIEQVVYSSKAGVKWASVAKFDEQGNQVLKVYFNADGQPEKIYKTIYTYDAQGNWIEKIEYENDKVQTISERKYNYFLAE